MIETELQNFIKLCCLKTFWIIKSFITMWLSQVILPRQNFVNYPANSSKFRRERATKPPSSTFTPAVSYLLMLVQFTIIVVGVIYILVHVTLVSVCDISVLLLTEFLVNAVHYRVVDMWSSVGKVWV